MMRRTTIVTLLAVVVSSLLVAGCGSAGSAEVTTDATSAPVPSATPVAARTAAPDFAGTSVGQQQVSLEGYRGKPLILAFWGSW